MNPTDQLANILALPMDTGNGVTTQCTAEAALIVARHLVKHGVGILPTPTTLTSLKSSLPKGPATP